MANTALENQVFQLELSITPTSITQGGMDDEPPVVRAYTEEEMLSNLNILRNKSQLASQIGSFVSAKNASAELAYVDYTWDDTLKTATNTVKTSFLAQLLDDSGLPIGDIEINNIEETYVNNGTEETYTLTLFSDDDVKLTTFLQDNGPVLNVSQLACYRIVHQRVRF